MNTKSTKNSDKAFRLFNEFKSEDAVPHISNGNMKLGVIPNWSLMPIVTCGHNCKACSGDCYACKSLMYKNVVKAWTDNTIMATKKLDELENSLMKYFSGMNAPRFFRVHVAGDFVNKDYAEMWYKVMKASPNTNFLAFTKQFELIENIKFNELDNVSIVLSGGWGIEIPEELTNKYPCAVCVESVEDIPEDGLQCPGNCDTCGMCWNLNKTGKNVYFLKH